MLDCQKIRQLREERNWTQLQLAAEADITQGTVSKLETFGDYNGLAALKKVARALGVDWATLVRPEAAAVGT